VDTGSREENASKQESRASVLIQSEPKMLQPTCDPEISLPQAIRSGDGWLPKSFCDFVQAGADFMQAADQ
jgi:hypothetical protein